MEMTCSTLTTSRALQSFKNIFFHWAKKTQEFSLFLRRHFEHIQPAHQILHEPALFMELLPHSRIQLFLASSQAVR